MSPETHPNTSAPIQILSAQLANQIAAGEVVERPASVVKELIENCLDAGASQVNVDIERGGHKKILVRDNGSGIAKEQLTLALERHATSKIRTIEDLDTISSMGFRGEALASISSVSRLTLSSKPKQQQEAWQAHAEGRDMEVSVQPAAHPDGTSIEVRDLFFNTPARRKFLRSGKTEFQHIEAIVKRVALTRPDVQFVLNHNGRTVLRYVSTSEESKRIAQVIGKSTLDQMTHLNYQFDGICLSGWVSALGEGEPTRDKQYVFVNHRMMRDKLISHALRQAYEETLPPQLFPCYVLHLTLPSNQLDINVHPAKHEVRFHEAKKIHDLVFKAITETLGGAQNIQENLQASHSYIQPLSSEKSVAQEEISFGVDKELKESTACTERNGSIQETSSSNENTSRPISSGFPNFSAARPSKSQISATKQFYQALSLSPSKGTDDESKEDFSNLVCQGDYFILRFNDNRKCYIARVLDLYELYFSHLEANSSVSQTLLMPLSLTLEDPVESSLIEQCLGPRFEFKIVKDRFILTAVPSAMRKVAWAQFMPRILSKIDSKKDVPTFSELMAGAYMESTEVYELELRTLMHELGDKSIKDFVNERGEPFNFKSRAALND